MLQLRICETVEEPQSDAWYTCRICGADMIIGTVIGESEAVSHHIKEGVIDYDADANHVAIAKLEKIRMYDLHVSYNIRLVQSLINRSIKSLQTEKPESLRLLLANRTKLEVKDFARIQTIAVTDELLRAPPPEGEGLETL